MRSYRTEIYLFIYLNNWSYGDKLPVISFAICPVVFVKKNQMSYFAACFTLLNKKIVEDGKTECRYLTIKIDKIKAKVVPA